MFNSYKIKYILLIILIMGVFIMSSNFFGNMTKNIIDHIKYRGTLVTGEITADNEDDTYDVKINNASSAYKNVETVSYGAMFSVGEIVVIGYEYGNKESPKILGSAKKIPQEPKQVEVSYSGGGEDGSGEGGGKQTETVTIYSSSADGGVSIQRDEIETYLAIHDSSNGDTVDNSSDHIVIGQVYFDSNPPAGEMVYFIGRSFLYFDTSIIPSNANIISVKLYIYCFLDNSDTDFYIVLQDGQPNYPHSSLVLADYNKNNYKNNGGQITTSGIAINNYTIIPFNSNGKNWVNKDGITKFCLRSSRDIASIQPTGLESIRIYTLEKGEGYKPKLTITYEI